VLSGAALADGRVVNVRLAGGLIESVGVPGNAPWNAPGRLPAADDRLDLAGFLLLPAPAEPHAHLDSSLVGGAATNRSGDLAGAVEGWRPYQASVGRDDFARRAMTAALMGLSNGATAIRSHVSVTSAIGLRAAEALIEVRERLRGQMEIQLVAFPMQLTGMAEEEDRRLLRAALELGVDAVGGGPYRDPDPAAYHETVLAIAAEFGRPVDLHTDETLDREVLTLPDLASRVRASGFRHRVTASHCVSLGVQPPAVIRGVAEQVAAAGVAVICNPQTNLYLQARRYESAPPRGLTAVRQLREAGVLVAGGGDDVRNPFNPVGRVDPLETASLLVTAGHLTVEDAYDAVSVAARAVMGLPAVRVEAGYPAELLAVRATTLAEVLAGGADRVVIHEGRVVSRTTITRDFPA
jgi:cytosine deaminase